MLSADTSPEANAKQLDAWRAMSPADKLALVQEMTRVVLWLEREGLRRRHPSLGPEELHRAALAAQVYPRAPR